MSINLGDGNAAEQATPNPGQSNLVVPQGTLTHNHESTSSQPSQAGDSDSSMPNTLRDRLKRIKLTSARWERKLALERHLRQCRARWKRQKAELLKSNEDLKRKCSEFEEVVHRFVEFKESERMQIDEIQKFIEVMLEILHGKDGNDTLADEHNASVVSLATNDDCYKKEIQLLKAKNDSLECENKLLNLDRRILLEQKRIDVLENKRQVKEVLSCTESRGLEENQLLKTENRVLMERLMSYEADKNRQLGETSNQWPASLFEAKTVFSKFVWKKKNDFEKKIHQYSDSEEDETFYYRYASAAVPPSSSYKSSDSNKATSKSTGDGSGSGGLAPSKSTLYVSNLDYSLTNSDLHTLFSTFGKIARVTVFKDRATRNSRGVAFIQFVSRDDALSAAGVMNGKVLNGRTLTASIAVDNGRAPEFIRKRVYKDKSRCYECGVSGHLSYECPKNQLGPMERPVPKKGRRGGGSGERRGGGEEWADDESDGGEGFEEDNWASVVDGAAEERLRKAEMVEEKKKKVARKASYFSDESDEED